MGFLKNILILLVILGFTQIGLAKSEEITQETVDSIVIKCLNSAAKIGQGILSKGQNLLVEGIKNIKNNAEKFLKEIKEEIQNLEKKAKNSKLNQENLEKIQKLEENLIKIYEMFKEELKVFTDLGKQISERTKILIEKSLKNLQSEVASANKSLDLLKKKIKKNKELQNYIKEQCVKLAKLYPDSLKKLDDIKVGIKRSLDTLCDALKKVLSSREQEINKLKERTNNLKINVNSKEL